MRAIVISCLTFLSLVVLTVNSTKTCPNGRWECTSASQDWNYVDCNQGFCECFSRQGFIGTADDNDKCRCDKQVFWEDGKAYCLNLKDSAELNSKFNNLKFNGAFKNGLNWFAGGSYTIKGTFQYLPSPTSNPITLPATLAIDAENQRIFFDHVANLHWIFPDRNNFINGISFASIFGLAGRCYLSNFTSYNQSEFHKDDQWIGTVINYRKEPVRQYLGRCFDHHIAEFSLALNNSQRLASYTEQTFGGVITSWSWDNLYQIFGASDRRITQSAVFDLSTLVKGSPDSNLFVYPSLCRSGNTFYYGDMGKPMAQQIPLF